MPRKGPQLTERAKLERDLREMIALRKLLPGSPEHTEAVKRLIMRTRELSAADLRQRHERWVAMGRPEFDSPEWKAELERLRKPVRRKPSAPPPTTLDTELLRLVARQAAGLPVELVELPGQSNYKQSKETQAEARRMYRWLWRNFPGLLNACDPELRELIREAGGVAPDPEGM